MNPIPVLLTCAFFFSLAIGSINYSIIFYLKDLFLADKGIIGLTASGQSMVFVVSMLVLMKWKAPPFRTVILMALGWAPLCIAAYLFLPFLGVTMAFHALCGLSMTLFWPRVGAWMARGREGSDLGRIMGRYNLSWSTGGVLGPVMGGALLNLDLRLPFLVGGLLLVCLFGLVFFALAKGAGSNTSETPENTVASTAIKTPLRLAARLGMVSLSFMIGCLMNIFPAYARDTFHLNEALIGTFLMARMAFNALGFGVWSRLTFWHFQPWAGPVVQACTLGLVLLFPWASNPVAILVLYGLAGILFSFQYSYSQFHSNVGYTDRNRGNTIHEIVINLAFILGTATCGWVSEAFSMPVAFAVAAGVTVVVAALQAASLGPRLAKGKAFCLEEAGQNPSVLR